MNPSVESLGRPPLPGRRARLRWIYAGTGFVGAVAILYGAVFLAPHHPGAPDPQRITIMSLAGAVSVVWAMVFATLAFRQLDEYQRTASKFAWYWGGLVGLVVSVPIYIFILLGGLHWLDPARFHLGADLAMAFRLGYAVAIFPMLLGFLVALGVWRITRR